MNRRSLRDHSFYEDWSLDHLLLLHILVNDKHDLLGSANCGHWDYDLSSLLECFVYEFHEVALDLLSWRHYVLLCTVGALCYQRFDPLVIPKSWVEKSRLSILVIAGVYNVVSTLANVKMHGCRSEYVSSIVENKLHIRRDIGDQAVRNRDRMFYHFPYVALIIDHPRSLSLPEFHHVSLKQCHERKSWLSAINRSVISIFVQRWKETRVIEMSVAYYNRVKLV